MENVIIIGSGCAGLTAAIYTGRANLNPLVITGNEFGGQIATTTEVENYPGFPTGLQGPELTEGMKQQAERFGARLEYDEVIEVELNRQPIIVKTHNATYETKALIVASGASPRKLNIPGEKELTGRGVSYCATCDGFFFKSKEIMVVGGGDSALQEALFLAKFGSKVTIVHRRDQLRAGPALIERVSKNDKIAFLYNSVLTKVERQWLGENRDGARHGDGRAARSQRRWRVHLHRPHSQYLALCRPTGDGSRRLSPRRSASAYQRARRLRGGRSA